MKAVCFLNLDSISEIKDKLSILKLFSFVVALGRPHGINVFLHVTSRHLWGVGKQIKTQLNQPTNNNSNKIIKKKNKPQKIKPISERLRKLLIIAVTGGDTHSAKARTWFSIQMFLQFQLGSNAQGLLDEALSATFGIAGLPMQQNVQIILASE